MDTSKEELRQKLMSELVNKDSLNAEDSNC